MDQFDVNWSTQWCSTLTPAFEATANCIKRLLIHSTLLLENGANGIDASAEAWNTGVKVRAHEMNRARDSWTCWTDTLHTTRFTAPISSQHTCILWGLLGQAVHVSKNFNTVIISTLDSVRTWTELSTRLSADPWMLLISFAWTGFCNSE